MGRTHALGGVAALAATALVLPPDLAPAAWGFVLAAASALVPDADNDRGSLMNRPYLMPLKIATLPLWWGAPHRGRTHSLLGLIAYTAMIVAWGFAIEAAIGKVLPDLGLPTLFSIGLAAGVGYASHLFLDSFNLLGQTLLWPYPAKITFPIWRAHGFIPGRFAAGSNWERYLTWPLLAAFTGWFVINALLGVVSPA